MELTTLTVDEIRQRARVRRAAALTVGIVISVVAAGLLTALGLVFFLIQFVKWAWAF